MTAVVPNKGTAAWGGGEESRRGLHPGPLAQNETISILVETLAIKQAMGPHAYETPVSSIKSISRTISPDSLSCRVC